MDKTLHMQTKIIISQNGPDSQDYEEVLLSDSERFEKKDEDNIPY